MVWGTQTLNLLKEWVRVGESTDVMVVVQEKTFPAKQVSKKAGE